MNLSARNIWPGTVTHIETGAVNSVVSVKLLGGAIVSSVITKNSVQRLGLKEGGAAMVVIKASSVMLGLGIKADTISARNILPGTVRAIDPGVVNDVVTVDLAGGDILHSVITSGSVKRLDLTPGKLVVGVIKASEVMLATE